MLARLFLVFVLVPLADLALLIQAGRVLGLGVTVAVVVVTAALGAWLTRLEGLRILRTVRAELDAGRPPTAALVDGLLVLVAGAVLLTPGFLTDAAGFFLLLPAGRRVVRRAVVRHFQRRYPPRVVDVEWHGDGS